MTRLAQRDHAEYIPRGTKGNGLTANIDNNTPPLIKFAVGGGGRSKTLIGSAIVAMAAAIVTIANVVMAAVVEPQQSWS